VTYFNPSYRDDDIDQPTNAQLTSTEKRPEHAAAAVGKAAPAMIARMVSWKRGRYTIDLVEITGWDNIAHRRIDAFDDITELPSRLWLYAEHIRIIGRPNAQPEGSGGGIVWLSHHALSRLCQRCNARRPRDLIVATHAFVSAVCEAETANILPRPVTNPAGHRLRVELGGGLGDCVAVFQRHESLDEITPVCVSILPPDAEIQL